MVSNEEQIGSLATKYFTWQIFFLHILIAHASKIQLGV